MVKIRNRDIRLGLKEEPAAKEPPMKTEPHDLEAVESRLWKAIAHQRTGMLGLTASSDHYQPMTAFAEPDSGEIWFFTRKETDLARQIDTASKAMFVFQQDHLQACIAGELSLSSDSARKDKYWNPIVAAWYPEGKDDPALTLLRFDCLDAEVWFSEGGLTRFAFEIAKANATHKTPDLGGRAHLDLH